MGTLAGQNQINIWVSESISTPYQRFFGPDRTRSDSGFYSSNHYFFLQAGRSIPDMQTWNGHTNLSASKHVVLHGCFIVAHKLVLSLISCFTSQQSYSQLFSSFKRSSTQIISLNCWPAFCIFMAWLAFLCSIQLCYSNVTMLPDLSTSLISKMRSEAIEMRPKVWTQALTNCTYLFFSFFFLDVCTDISE